MSDRLGHAEWVSPAELAGRYPYAEGDFWLGREPISGTPLGHTDNRHILLCSGTRAGKGTTTIINNLCLWPGSVVVVDPKGENATVTASRRGSGSEYCEGMGQEVQVLDPFGAADVPEEVRSRFNPLDALDPSSLSVIDQAGQVADAIVMANKQAKDTFWDDSARSMVKGVILHVITSPMFEGRRTLLTVRDLISRGDHEGVAILREDGVDKLPSAHALLWQAMSRNESLNGVIAGIGDKLANLVLADQKLFQSMLQSVDRQTEFLDSPRMRSCVEASDFDLDDLKRSAKGLSLYLCLPEGLMGEHFRWLRMMLTLIVQAVERDKAAPRTGHNVLMVMDEFLGLERIKPIERAASYIAGYGLTMMFVVQGLSRLKDVYDHAWEELVGNCGLRIFFGVDDQFTREYASKLIGDTEVRPQVSTIGTTEGTNESTTRGTSTSRTEGESSGSSFGRSASVSESTSLSTTEGQNRSTTEGTGRSVTEGRNTSVTDGISQTDGWNESSTRGTNWSKNKGTSRNSGQSHNASWSPNPLLLRETAKFLPLVRENETANYGSNTSIGRTDGTSWGGSQSLQSGRSGSRGMSRSNTEGLSESVTDSQNRSITTGESFSKTQGRSLSNTESESITETMGRSRSLTDGTSTATTTGSSSSTSESTAETVHKRRLIAPEDVGHRFDRPEDGEPGWALVLIGGKRPAVVQRTPYYSDPMFAWLFDPHPNHATPTRLVGPIDIHVRESGKQEASLATVRWLHAEGETVKRGEPLFVAKVQPCTFPEIDDVLYLSKAEDEHGIMLPTIDLGDQTVIARSRHPDHRTVEVAIPSPVTGVLMRRAVDDGETLPRDERYAVVETNHRRHLVESGEELDCPFTRLRAFKAASWDVRHRVEKLEFAKMDAEREAKAEQERRETEAMEARRRDEEEQRRRMDEEAEAASRRERARRSFVEQDLLSDELKQIIASGSCVVATAVVFIALDLLTPISVPMPVAIVAMVIASGIFYKITDRVLDRREEHKKRTRADQWDAMGEGQQDRRSERYNR
ncbi:MAG: type IV secretory system conjugative DNA transfer family protein [Planctomycetota bacterium]